MNKHIVTKSIETDKETTVILDVDSIEMLEELNKDSTLIHLKSGKQTVVDEAVFAILRKIEWELKK